MCGRFTLLSPADALAEAFGGKASDYPPPSYNIAPTRLVAGIRAGEGGREVALFRWGLIPSWAEDPGIGNRMINARAETLAEKPSFRQHIRSRSCLVLADGFYEWSRGSRGQGSRSRGREARQPHYVTLKARRPFAFAGLWERWSGPEGPIESCTIVTTQANRLLRPIHDRMPVILRPEDHALWLDLGTTRTEAVEGLLQPYRDEEMTVYRVGAAVNDPRHDTPVCIERA